MADARLFILSVVTIVSQHFGIIEGQRITPVYVQSNAPVTLTCPADDQATSLTWTGPGGTLYANGTMVEADLDNGLKSRISAPHTGGSFTLMFTEFRSSDTGIYTCTVDGTMDTQMVILKGVTSASPVYTRQGGTVTLQCPDTDTSILAQWSITNSGQFIYTQWTNINPAIPDDTKTRLNVTRQDGTYNLQISDVQLSDVREYKCNIGTLTDTLYHLLLYSPPAFPEIENTISVDGQNRTTGTEDGSMTMTCNSRGGTPAASLSWIKDGTTLVTSDNTVQYTKVFTRADDRTVYTCQSSSPALTSPQTISVLIYLDLKPAQPTISDQLSRTENTNLQVVCESTGSRPAASIQWNVGGTWQLNNPIEVKVKDSAIDTFTVTSTLSLPVTRQDNGNSVYCRASNDALSGGRESVQRSIAVLFGPDSVSITGNRVVLADGTNNLTLTCTTQEYNKHIHITWYNGTTQLPNTAGITNTSGIYGGSVSTQALQLTPDKYQDGNVIKCVVQNEDVTLGEKTASVTFNINYTPSTSVSVSVNSTTEGRENTAVDLTCHVTGGKPVPSLQWMCPESVSKTAPITGSQDSSHTSVITVTLTRQVNGKRCNCTGSQTDTTWTESDQSPVFAVRFGPDSASITGNGVVVADGTNTLTLTCTTQDYNKHVHITWYNGTARVPNTVGVTNTSGTYWGSVSTQVLQLTPDRYQNGNVIKCVVQNEDVTLGEKTVSVTLNINYQPYLTLTPTPGVTVIEGGELDIRCDVDSNPAPSSITWSKVGGQLSSNTDVISGVLRIPSTHRTDRGTYQCTADNSVSKEQESITIDIYYPPDIQVTYTNTTVTSPDRVLTCVPDGNPDTYQFGQWQHTAEDGTEIRQLTGSSSPLRSVLTLPDPGVTRRYEDTGYYICKVSNGIPVPSSYRSSSVFFVVEAPPVVIANTTVVKGQIGENATMEVEFYSQPAVSSSDVSWTRGTDGLRPLNKSVTSVDTRLIQISFHGVDINVKGYVAAIKFHNLVEQDFGNYTVTMENSIRMNNFTIWFKSASPPLPPNNLASLTYDSSSITLEWTPSFNGGAEQEFVIGYKSDISQDFVDLAPIPDTHESTQSYQITGLKPGTTHFTRIYSENEIGRSGVVFLNQTTAAAGEDEPSIGPLVGGIAGSALGLIAIAAVAVVIYKRRTATKGDDMEMINSPNKVSADDDSDGLKPNILYESSDGLKANVLYESAGANFQPQPGPSSEYAIVCKPNKKNGAAVDPNSVYTVVDKSSKDKKDSNDVYAVVDKQPKEKGGKGKKKQREQKQQKGGKKDKKKAGHGNAEKKKAGHGNDGDVYENVTSIPGQEEQLYANSTETAKHDQRPSRKRNQDGLVYLEVEFKDNGTGERRAVIHGIENRNDYVDIDFTKRADLLPDQDEHVEETDGKAKD